MSDEADVDTGVVVPEDKQMDKKGGEQGEKWVVNRSNDSHDDW